MSSNQGDRLFRISAPYRRLQEVPLEAPSFREEARGEALVWQVSLPINGRLVEIAGCRPPGVGLLLILPAAQSEAVLGEALSVVSTARPTHVLPHLRDVGARHCRHALRHPPLDLAGEVTAYLSWRGIQLELGLKRIIQRTFDLCYEIETVTSLARSLHISRRALGRRFSTAGLPVPSHWLQAARLLTAALHLQSSDESVFTVATDLGYPDGFSMSNQMMRLMSIRPSEAREYLGWEWILEQWLVQEANQGRIARRWSSVLLGDRSGATSRRPSRSAHVEYRDASTRIDR